MAAEDALKQLDHTQASYFPALPAHSIQSMNSQSIRVFVLDIFSKIPGQPIGKLVSGWSLEAQTG